MALSTYDPQAKYWIVYQYSDNQCPHIFTSNSHEEAIKFYDEVPAIIIRFKLSSH